jgi:hypothetical protein
MRSPWRRASGDDALRAGPEKLGQDARIVGVEHQRRFEPGAGRVRISKPPSQARARGKELRLLGTALRRGEIEAARDPLDRRKLQFETETLQPAPEMGRIGALSLPRRGQSLMRFAAVAQPADAFGPDLGRSAEPGFRGVETRDRLVRMADVVEQAGEPDVIGGLIRRGCERPATEGQFGRPVLGDAGLRCGLQQRGAIVGVAGEGGLHRLPRGGGIARDAVLARAFGQDARIIRCQHRHLVKDRERGRLVARALGMRQPAAQGGQPMARSAARLDPSRGGLSGGGMAAIRLDPRHLPQRLRALRLQGMGGTRVPQCGLMVACREFEIGERKRQGVAQPDAFQKRARLIRGPAVPQRHGELRPDGIGEGIMLQPRAPSGDRGIPRAGGGMDLTPQKGCCGAVLGRESAEAVDRRMGRVEGSGALEEADQLAQRLVGCGVAAMRGPDMLKGGLVSPELLLKLSQRHLLAAALGSGCEDAAGGLRLLGMAEGQGAGDCRILIDGTEVGGRFEGLEGGIPPAAQTGAVAEAEPGVEMRGDFAEDARVAGFGHAQTALCLRDFQIVQH